MEELLSRHRKEQRELQGRITHKKKNATKKTRKGINDECETMERDLRAKQQAEVEALDPSQLDKEMGQLDLDANSGPIVSEELNGHAARNDAPLVIDTKEEQAPVQPRPKKPNRQKERLARRAAEQEAQAAAAAEEAANLPDLRDQEIKAMHAQMTKRDLIEIFIQPDGHCLYSAVAHGLPPEEVKKSGPFSPGYQNVRYTAADFISKHPDDYVAFLEEPLDQYVKKIKDTAEWGGQLELLAIARAYEVNIKVLQADGRVEKIESGGVTNKPDIWLAYYRHSFGLGEHYNALVKKEKT